MDSIEDMILRKKVRLLEKEVNQLRKEKNEYEELLAFRTRRMNDYRHAYSIYKQMVAICCEENCVIALQCKQEERPMCIPDADKFRMKYMGNLEMANPDTDPVVECVGKREEY